VQRHGGIVWIEDNPGGGCRLIFTIPRADSAPGGPTLITPGSNTEPLAPR
jgi:hypothetical protein